MFTYFALLQVNISASRIFRVVSSNGLCATFDVVTLACNDFSAIRRVTIAVDIRVFLLAFVAQ